MVIAAMKFKKKKKKKLVPLKKRYDQLDNILKSRDSNFADKDVYSQSYVISSSHVWM